MARGVDETGGSQKIGAVIVMNANNVETGGKGRGQVLAMLPVLLGQIDLVWMVSTRQIDYVQVAVMAMVEVLLVLLISALVLSPNIRTARNRLGEFLILAVCEGMVLQVLVLMPFSKSATQFHDALAAFDGVRTSYLHMLGYLGLVLGTSCLSALTSGNPKFWWYRNVTSQSGVTFFALFISVLLLAPVGAVVTHMHLSTSIFAIAWTVLYGVMRLLLFYGVSAGLSPESMQTKYAVYAAGAPEPPKRKIDYKARAFGVPFFLVGVAITAYAISSLRADVAYNATALRADGIVVDVRYHQEKKGETSTTAVIEFNDVDGKQFRIVTPAMLGTQWYQVNAHVTMLYQPRHPGDARVENAGNSDALPYVVGVFGLIALSIGLLVMLTPMFDTVVKKDDDQDEKTGFAAFDALARAEKETQ